MLLSMTGYGEARSEEGGQTVIVELRTINNRYFKFSLRTSEGYGTLETPIEAALRPAIRRGTLQVNLRVERARTPEDYTINEVVLESYFRQVQSLHQRLGIAEHARLENILLLPGVVDENVQQPAVERDWPQIERTLLSAAEKLHAMRSEEGRAMQADLAANLDSVAAELARIEARAPAVAGLYQDRLLERINKLLTERGVAVEAADVIREVGFFAERCDISEEIVRLRSHLDQFRGTMSQPESNGKKLDFITQEMFREANTIGSKANDTEITRHVIEIKSAIERIREMVQNVE